MTLLDELLAGTLTEAEADALRELGTAVDWALESLQDAPVAPTKPSLRARLLDAVSAPSEALAPFAARLASVFDVTVDRARCYLQSVFDADAWEDAIGDGVALVHLVGGPATAGADVGFVRLAAGGSFPHHRHDGHETTFVLAGAMRNDDGAVYRPGDQLVLPAGSEHTFEALAGDDLVFAVVVFGVSFGEGVDAP
jgi:quercetin dioxygenase-like cupin family protein